MGEDERNWLAKFRLANGLTKTPPLLDEIQAVSDALLKASRKPPRRLDRILSFDRITLTITNLRARAGLKPKGFAR